MSPPPHGALSSWPLAELFDPLDDVQFWIKDIRHHYLHGNRALILNYGLNELSDLVGRTDYDFSAPFLADQFWIDDEQVVKGHRVVNRIELVGGTAEPPRWSVTHKIPLCDAHGQVVGTSGTTRWLDGSALPRSGPSGFDQVLKLIRDHYRTTPGNAALARAAGLSTRSFERRFRQSFHTSPQAYIRKLKVRMACRLLVHSDLPLAAVAIDAGFADQSHFNHEFKRQIHRTPGEYRAHYKR